MPSKATISVGEKFLYDFKAGPAGGRLRRPSSAGSTRTATGALASPLGGPTMPGILGHRVQRAILPPERTAMNPRMTPSHANPSRSNTFRMAVLSTAVPACTRTTAACSNSHPVSSAAAVDPVPRPRSAGSKIAMPSWATPAGRFQARP